VARGAAVHARHRRALRLHDRARQPAHPAYETPDGSTERDYLRSLVMAACASATATRRPPRPSSAWRWSSASSTGWASTPTS
jgi:hypothetical protein